MFFRRKLSRSAEACLKAAPRDENEAVALSQINRGERVRIAQLCGQADTCRRLREMGFCEEAEIHVVNAGAAILCQICGARVGLSRQLAATIMVSRMAA